MKKIFGLVVCSVLLVGCAGNTSPVGYGLITNVKGPITATDNVASSKTGEACATNVLGIVAAGDASIAEAKRKASITKVATVDYSSAGVYPFFGSTCTIVTGE